MFQAACAQFFNFISCKFVSRPRPTVTKALKQELAGKTKLLLAVSGGIDSVCLLHGCCELSRLLKLELEVAHVDHGLRAESCRDAGFVKSLAKRYGLPFHLKRARPPARGVNLEAWGRKLRYDFFLQCLKRRKLNFVLTAHNADDVAETFLMRLVSNKELTSIERFDARRGCLRPMLAVSRREIERYAGEHRLEYVEDLTNRNIRWLRNRVRHKLLKLLREEFDARIVEVISNRAQGIMDDGAYLNELAEKAAHKLKGLGFGSADWLRAVRKELSKLAAPVRWRFVERLFLGELGFKLGRLKAELACDFLEKGPAALDLPGSLSIRQYRGGIRLKAGRGMR